MKRYEAALKGAGEVSFTVVSISLSLNRRADSAAADVGHHRPAVP